ncbi:hypothetical protein [Chryseobacterium fistulae]|uniref:YaiO beta-barrel domain-containing protein n=1 Tax=Chryseobacterium fistulae TaxID=2675058 RepID=A0A6N4XK95_9FLAO|nr:hypothetical protein [Chryseobacterium fistulae]CAA7386177.1 hypothetical protein CHRY9393_00468 [Chryseobacterium fistulae]
MKTPSIPLLVLAYVFFFFSYQTLNAQILPPPGNEIVLKKDSTALYKKDSTTLYKDSTRLYIMAQQQYTSFDRTVTLNQSSAGIKLKKVNYTLISNLEIAYSGTRSGWQSSSEFYYTPRNKKTYQYASFSISNAVWYPNMTAGLSNYYIGIKKLEIENGVKYISLSNQKDIWMINTGLSYALNKNLFQARWIYLNNGISNNDFILGYRYYFNENEVTAINVLFGDNNIIPEFQNIPGVAAVKQYQAYYGFNFNTTFRIVKDLHLGMNYTYKHFNENENVNSWDLHIVSLGITYKLKKHRAKPDIQ